MEGAHPPRGFCTPWLKYCTPQTGGFNQYLPPYKAHPQTNEMPTFGSNPTNRTVNSSREGAAEDGSYRQVQYISKIQRKATYYIWVIIVPTYIISSSCVAGFFAPGCNSSERQEKVKVCIFCDANEALQSWLQLIQNDSSCVVKLLRSIRQNGNCTCALNESKSDPLKIWVQFGAFSGSQAAQCFNKRYASCDESGSSNLRPPSRDGTPKACCSPTLMALRLCQIEFGIEFKYVKF
jgi:hypothetical protein